MRGMPPVPCSRRRAPLRMFTVFGAVIGAVTALIGVIFGLLQLSLQARAATLDVLIVINENRKTGKRLRPIERTTRGGRGRRHSIWRHGLWHEVETRD